jgi:hypothetical protein
MFAKRNIVLHEALLKEAEEKVAADPSTALKLLLGGALGGAAVGIPAHLLTKKYEEAKRKTTRDRAFGAGVATGVATPKLLRGLLNIAQSRGLIAPDATASNEVMA